MQTVIDRRGLDLTRFVIAQSICEQLREAERYGVARWGGGSTVAGIIKSAVVAGTSTDSVWAAPLIQQAGVEFFALVRERSLVGRMAGIRNVPLNTRTVRQSSGGSAAWIAEGKVKPVTSSAYSPAASLPALKVVAQAVATEELLRFADPDAELTIRDDLVAAVSEALDATFVDWTNAGASGVSPASITYGATAITGTKYLDDDLKDLVHAFAGDLSRAYFLANPETFVLFSGADRPLIGARGGSMLGIPALASRKVPIGDMILADAGGIAFGSGQTEVSSSNAGTIQMETTPDSPATASTVMTSLWQNNLKALQAIQYANWSASTGAVAMLTGLTNIGDSP